MNRFVTAALCGSLAFCAAQAFAGSTGSTAPNDSSAGATKQKLMTECMSHEGQSNTQAKQDCQAQVQNELMDIRNAGHGSGQKSG